MNKKYLHYFFLVLITCNTFGINKVKILVPITSQTAHKLVTSKFPPGLFTIEKGMTDNAMEDKYKDMGSAMQYIANQLQPEKKLGSTLHKHTKKRLLRSNQKYILFEFLDSSKTYVDHYYFEWKKKSYSKLKELEKHIADYYQANNKTNLEFLYPYKRIDKEEFGQVDNSPWAININQKQHSFLWREAITKEVTDSQIDEFIIIKDSYIHKFTNPYGKDPIILFKVLVDENNQVIAKNINGTISYRTN